MQDKLLHFWNQNKRTLIFSFVCVTIWAVLAHGYAFLNLQPSHDSLDGLHTIYPNRTDLHKIELCRIFYPAYCAVFRNMFYLPYLTGIYTIIWLALSAFLVISALNITSALNKVITCGIMTVNITVTALAATYGNDLDVNMFATLMACSAFFLWRKKGKLSSLLSIIAVAISLGLYQSYVCVTVSLVIISLVKDLLEGKSVSAVFLSGVRAAALIVLGGILYSICIPLILRQTDMVLAVNRSNSLSQLSLLSMDMLPFLCAKAYANWTDFFTNSKTFLFSAPVINTIHLLLFAAGIFSLIAILLSKGIKPLQKAFLVLLVFLFPLASNAIYILSLGNVHDLMQYAFIFAYLLLLILLDHSIKFISKTKFTRNICCGMVFLILWGGIQTSNIAYHKKTLISQATYSKMTEILHEMHLEGYDPEVPLMIEGTLPLTPMPGFENVSRIIGMDADNCITTDSKSFKSYFQYILGEPINFCTQQERILVQNHPLYQELETYPTYGYIRMINDVMVIRLE